MQKLNYHIPYSQKDFNKLKICFNCDNDTVQDIVFSGDTIWFDCLSCFCSIRGVRNIDGYREITTQINVSSNDYTHTPFFFINKNGIRLVYQHSINRIISNDPHAFSIKELKDKLLDINLLL